MSVTWRGGEHRILRGRSRDPITDVRELGEVAPLFAPHGFFRVHRECAVNLRRVALIRPRPSGRDWELKMEPPVNRVIPIARESLEDLWAVLGPTSADPPRQLSAENDSPTPKATAQGRGGQVSLRRRSGAAARLAQTMAEWRAWHVFLVSPAGPIRTSG
jgi:hypothetical protein